MIKKFEIDESSVANAPLKIFEWIAEELQKKEYRAGASGYRFIAPSYENDKITILSDIDFYAISQIGRLCSGRIDISRTVVNNQYVASKKIADSKELKLSAIEKYALEVELDGRSMHINARELIEYIENNF